MFQPRNANFFTGARGIFFTPGMARNKNSPIVFTCNFRPPALPCPHARNHTIFTFGNPRVVGTRMDHGCYENPVRGTLLLVR